MMTYIGPADTQGWSSLVETSRVPSTVRLKISLGSKPGVSVLDLTPGKPKGKATVEIKTQRELGPS